MPLPHTILSVLDTYPELHGYRIREWVQRAAWSFPMSNPSLYPTLRRLEDQGFVTSRGEIERGRQRRVYAITETGRKELRSWLADPDSMSMERGAWRDPMMLKIKLLRDGSLEGSREWVRRGIAYWESYLADFADAKFDPPLQRSVGRDQIGKYLRLAVGFGVELAQLRLRQYRRLLEEIEVDLG